MSSVKEAITGLERHTQKVVSGTLLSLASRIIKASPVDEGTFRGNWQASLNNPIDATTDNTSEVEAISKATAAASNIEYGDTFYLTNNLPYAVPLEFGSSSQAPQGMLRISVAQYQQAINEANR